ncbi:DUF732 domain-containing protein [Arthrobacter sp. N1]|uniref:DUF732 domain-containing protein n=1 Tax=Arthrobacter sp. N1 TaxID=619291 RepID=UPI003BAF7B8A
MTTTAITTAVEGPIRTITVGVDIHSRPTPTRTPTRTPMPSPTPEAVSTTPSSDELFGASSPEIDAVFIDQLVGSEPTLGLKDSAGVIVIGKSFCQIYDNGGSSSDVSDLILQGAGFENTLPELVSIHGAGVGAYCPEHIGKLGT